MNCGNYRSGLLASIAIVVTFVSVVGAAKIPKRIETQIKTDIVPAFERDDYFGIQKVLATWVTKFDGEELDQIDTLLENHRSARIGVLLLDARIRALLAGQEEKNITPRELTRSMPVLKDRIESQVRATRSADYFQDEAPDYDKIQDYHDAFWDIHVARNKLSTTHRLAQYGSRMKSQMSERSMRGLSDLEKESLDIDFSELVREVNRVDSELNEIRIELQVLAIEKAAKLVRESDDYKERLRAGAILAFYADPVVESLRKASPQDFARPRLRDEQLLPSVEANLRYARESSGAVIDQARLLYLGMHWWMRGRYGQGPDGMGLLKSVHALRSAAAQFPLYMPTKPPTPSSPSASSYGYSIPKFDRRHHYIWMYEYRTIRENVYHQSFKDRSSSEDVTSTTKLSRFY